MSSTLFFMRRKALAMIAAIAALGSTAAIAAVPITGQNLFQARQSMSERWMHQDLSDSENQLLLYQNVTPDFEVAEIVFYAFGPGGEEGVSTLDDSPEGLMNGYASGPYVIHPPAAINPEGTNARLLEDYNPLPGDTIEDMAWPSSGKGLKPTSPRVSMVSICGSIVPEVYQVRKAQPENEVIFGYCGEVGSFYELVNNYGGNRIKITVPPYGEVHVAAFQDWYDQDYSNNSGIIAYKVEKVEDLF